MHAETNTSSVATYDHLFLAYNARAVTRFKNVDDLRHIYDLTTMLLARLPSSAGDRSRSGLLPKPLFAPGSPSLNREKFIANLDHILRCLRQAALEALIHHGMKALEEDLKQWHQSWLCGRQLDRGWFSEWPGGRRPLSTTWPWNIRPSLVVLWGVCWMFYDNSTRSISQSRQQLEEREVASSSWLQPTPQSDATATSRQQNIATWEGSGNIPGFPDSAWSQTDGGGLGGTGVNSRSANFWCTPFCSTTLPGYQSLIPTTTQSPYKAYYPVIPPTATPEAPIAWPQDQGNYLSPVLPPDSGSDPTYLPLHRQSAQSSAPFFHSAQYYWDDPPLYEPRQWQQQPVSQLPANRRIASGGTFYPYAPSSQQTFSQGDSQAAAFLQSLRPPTGSMQNYPSPHSDVSKDETRSSNFSVLPSNDVSPYIMFAASPSVASHPSRVSPGRGSEEPPRNSSGQITCLHPKCAQDLPVFGRSTWTSILDRGLSRHQREVHRQHGGPTTSYMCPHSDCKRSTGSGFSRKENLQEHLRRVHRHTEDMEVAKKTPEETTRLVSSEQRKRRRRIADEDEDEGEDEAESTLPKPRKRRREVEESDDDAGEDLSAQVKRLRRELQEKDERLKKLEGIVEVLTKRNVQPA
ncbi:MAG: hypothetical protein Q9192_004765 [Flavoplaca navasiana]